MAASSLNSEAVVRGLEDLEIFRSLCMFGGHSQDIKWHVDYISASTKVVSR